MKKNLRKIVIGIVVVLIIVAIVSVIVSNKKNENKELQENYILIRQDNKYGIIDKNGKVMIEPQYDMIQIPNPEKPVFVCLYDYNTQTMEYKTKVLNQNAEQIYTTYSNVNAIQIKNNTEKNAYQTQVLSYVENNKVGLISIDGKKITNAIYESIESIAYKTNTLAVQKDDKYGVIDLKGKEVIKPEYDTITADLYYNKETNYDYAGYIVSIKTESGYRFGYINYKGKKILEPEYTQIDRVPYEEKANKLYIIAYKNGQAGLLKNNKNILPYEYEDIKYNTENNVVVVKKARKYGVNNLKGKVIIPLEYENISIEGNSIYTVKGEQEEVYDINGKKQENADYISSTNTDSKYKVVINKDNKFGIIDEKNEKIIDYKYDYLEYLFNNYFIATVEGKVGVIDDKGKYVIESKYDSVQKLEDTNIIQTINASENMIEMYNKDLELVVSMEGASVSKEDNYIKMVSESKIEYLDLNGYKKKNTELLNKNLFAQEKDGKWGFIDANGNVKIDYKYDMVTEFNNKGFAGIKLNGLWGVIKEDAEIILEPKYKIKEANPDFIGEYYKVDTVYGRTYYSKDIIK